MTKKLRAYYWEEWEDAEGGVAVVAYSIKEARKMAYDWWAGEVGLNGEYTDQKIKWLKKADVTGITSPRVIEDFKDGLKRGMYGYVIEEECEKCSSPIGMADEYNLENGKLLCEECKEKKQIPGD